MPNPFRFLIPLSKFVLVLLVVLACFAPGVVQGCGKEHVLVEVRWDV